jgi:hypothetical protein
MAQIIKIKRSTGSTAPATLNAGELAYTGGDGKLYIGDPANSNAVTIIAGNEYVDLFPATAGTLEASKLVQVDSSKKINEWLVDNITLDGNTISTTSGDLIIDPTTGSVDLATGGAIEFKILDGSATSLTISEGSNNYITLDTTNAAEKITLAKDVYADQALYIDGDNSTGSGGVKITNGVIDLKNGGSDSKIVFYCSASNAHAQTLQAAPHSSAASNTLTLPGTGTILATQDGTETLTNKTLTSPDINTPDIDGGTMDSTVIGGTTAAAGTFTNLTANGAIDIDGTGTSNMDNVIIGANTAAAGTFTVANVDNLTLDGNTLSSTDTDGNIVLDPNGAGTIDASSARITSVADPTGAQDAATKAYVDAVKTGLDVKASVRVATTGNITISTALNSGDTIDGVTLADGDRVLVKDQTDATENGIYVVAATPARATDADSASELTGGTFTFVEEGTANADNGYVFTHNGTPTLGSTDLPVSQFSGAGQITAGDGLSKTGNTLDVNDDNITLEINADNVRIKGISATAIGDLLIGAASNGGYTRLVKPTSDDALLTMGTAGTASWTTTLDGGTF